EMTIKVSAPGRICLFGEDQDYMGLSVITAAINLRTYIEGNYSNRDKISIDLLDIRQKDDFYYDELPNYRKKRDYLRSGFNILKRKGFELSKGLSCKIWSKLPIGAGLSSSSVLVVAWIKFLSELFNLNLNPEKIADLAYQAEVVEFKEKGGNMDHFASALGYGMFMECITPPHIEKIDLDSIKNSFVIGDTCEKKKTLQTHNVRRAEFDEGIRLIKHHIPDFDLKITPISKVEKFLRHLPRNPSKRLWALLQVRDVVTMAKDELSKNNPDAVHIAELIDLHHNAMRDGLENSTPKIEKIIYETKNAGALAGKIVGSGNGGCVVIFCPDNQQKIANVINHRCNGKAYIVDIDEGIKKY
ncbi:MAG: GHMP kinase, partial [Candidatus Helarchaeota archaeon]|nr:GHMP kinase [Candidatus Helarchaeota archaeon]